MIVDVIAAASFAVWLYLLFGRGGFWLASERDHWLPAQLPAWPAVAIVIPARNEAACIGETLASLFRQDYGGAWTIIVVDDGSEDETAAVVRATAAAHNVTDRLTVIPGKPLPAGWTGKLWAVKQGVEAASTRSTALPEFLLLSDADIVYQPGVIGRLVAHAKAEGLVLASLMVRLRCESFAERSLIPAFVFFFQMLYPFTWVNQRERKTAAAAGGCMLLHAPTLKAAGGIDAIRNALIDDCALAKVMKAHGPIWLGLTKRARSIRPYPMVGDIRRMIARSAYAQLGYSLLLLLGTVAGMALTYLVPPAMTLLTTGHSQMFGLLAWGMMALAFQPTLRLYRASPLWGLALPAIAFCYLVFTLDSALQFARGKGGLWKGRVQAQRS